MLNKMPTDESTNATLDPNVDDSSYTAGKIIKQITPLRSLWDEPQQACYFRAWQNSTKSSVSFVFTIGHSTKADLIKDLNTHIHGKGALPAINTKSTTS